MKTVGDLPDKELEGLIDKLRVEKEKVQSLLRAAVHEQDARRDREKGV